MSEEKVFGEVGFNVHSYEIVTLQKKDTQKILINTEIQKEYLLMAANMHQTFNTNVFTNEQDIKSIVLWVGYDDMENESPHKAINFQHCKLESLEKKLLNTKFKNIRIILNPDIIKLKDLKNIKKKFLITIEKFQISILSVKFHDPSDLDLFGLFYPYYFSSPVDFFSHAEPLSISKKESQKVKFKYILTRKKNPHNDDDSEIKSPFKLFDAEKISAFGSCFELKIKEKLLKSLEKFEIIKLKFLCNEILLKKHLEFFEDKKKEEISKHYDEKIRFPNSIFVYYPTENLDEKWKIFEEGAVEKELGMDFIGNGIYLTTFPQKAFDVMVQNKKIKSSMDDQSGSINLIAGYCIPGDTIKVYDSSRKGLDIEKDANFLRIDNKNIPVDEKDDQHFDWLAVKNKNQFYPCFELALRLKK
jgi:hypothetical protein